MKKEILPLDNIITQQILLIESMLRIKYEEKLQQHPSSLPINKQVNSYSQQLFYELFTRRDELTHYHKVCALSGTKNYIVHIPFLEPVGGKIMIHITSIHPDEDVDKHRSYHLIQDNEQVSLRVNDKYENKKIQVYPNNAS